MLHDLQHLLFWFNSVVSRPHQWFSCFLLNVLLFLLNTVFPPSVLSRLGCSILFTQFPQDLTFIGRMYKDMDEPGFRFALQAIYISFTAPASAPICCGVSIFRVEFSYLFPTYYSRFGFCPISLFTRRCYHTFINTL